MAKSKPTLNLASPVSTSSPAVQNPIASKSPRILKTPGRKYRSRTRKPEAGEFNRDAASSSQGWEKDAVLDVRTRRLVATDDGQERLNFPEY